MITTNVLFDLNSYPSDWAGGSLRFVKSSIYFDTSSEKESTIFSQCCSTVVWQKKSCSCWLRMNVVVCMAYCHM